MKAGGLQFDTAWSGRPHRASDIWIKVERNGGSQAGRYQRKSTLSSGNSKWKASEAEAEPARRPEWMGRGREEKEARDESKEVKRVVGHVRPRRPLALTLCVGRGLVHTGAWEGLSRAVT